MYANINILSTDNIRTASAAMKKVFLRWNLCNNSTSVLL